jgi:hypothetical protein
MAVKIDIKWADNTADLTKALREGTDAIVATRAGVDKLVQSFSGDKLIAAANRMVAAISEIGGAEKLTNAERDRTNALLDKAIQKYTALGKDAPSAMLATFEATKQTSEATEGWTASLTRLGNSWAANIAGGQLLHDAVLKVMETFKGMAEFLPELVLEGSKVAGIEKNFDRLTEAAGLTASTLMTTLRTATHNTVTDFDLMKRVNQDLAAGLNLSDAQFGKLAEGAYALAKATGVDVKDALNTMSDALLTGRTRSLALLTGKISLTAAERNHAAALQSTAEHLTDEGKLEAARVAIFDSVATATERLGVQTDGLGTIVKQADVWWKNFQEDLGKTIAASPVLQAELRGIRDAVTEAFGGNQQALMASIARYVDDLAVGLLTLAKAGVYTAAAIANEWALLERTFREGAIAVDATAIAFTLAALAVLKFKEATAYTDADQQHYAATIKVVEGNLASLKDHIATQSAAWLDADDRQLNVMATTNKYLKVIDDLQAKLAAVKRNTTDYIGPLEDEAAAHDHAAAAGQKHAGQLQATKEELAKAAKAAKDWADVIKEVESGGDDFHQTILGIDGAVVVWAEHLLKSGVTAQTVAKYYGLTDTQVKALEADIKAETAATKILIEIREKWEAGTTKLNESLLTVNSTELIAIKQHLDLAAAMKMVEQSIPPTVAGFYGAAGALENVGLKSTELRDLQVKLALQTKSLGDVFTDTFAALPSIMAKAFEGGGGVEGAAKAYGATLANDVIASYADQMKKSGHPLTKGQTAAIGAGTAGASTVGGLTGDATAAMIGGAAASIGGAALAASAAGSAMAAAGVGGAIALGAATMGIGAAAVGVYMLAKHFLTVSQNEKDARVEFQKLQDLYGSLPATIDAVGQAYALMGYNGDQARSALQQALDATHKSAAEEDAALRPIMAVLAAATEQAANIKTGVDNLTAAGQAFGGTVPDQFKAAVRELANMKGVTDDEKTALLSLSADVKPNFEQLTQTAAKYGVTLEGLGKSFQQANIEGRAKDIAGDFDALVKAGGDAGGILSGMSDEISKLVNDSARFGTAIPENMRPLIDELLRAGKLTDENGDKLTDVSNITFEATPIDDSMTKLADAIEKLTTSLESLAKLQIPPVVVPVTYVSTNAPPGAATPPVPAFAEGSGGFQDFGSGTLAVLHGREAVITEGQALRGDATVTSVSSAAPAASNTVHVTFAISTLDASDFQTVVEQKVFPALVNQLRRGRGVTAMRDVMGVS